MDAMCHPLCDQVDMATQSRSVAGNRLDLLIDGESFVPAMLDSIREAQWTVDLELFRVHPGHLSRLLVHLLSRLASKGLRVRAIVDAFGSRATPPDTWRALRAAGVQLCIFAPFGVRPPRRLVRRNHRKIVIVDDSVAYVGGMSFDDVFFRNPDGPTWRESMVRVKGPVLASIKEAFASSWRDAAGAIVEHRAPRFPMAHEGTSVARFILSSATEPSMRLAILALIRHARRSIYITNPFVLPDREIRGALKQAAGAGVDVRILVPGGRAFDRFKIIRLAMNDLYEGLLKSGVRIFEYQPAMLHAKTIVIDETWCAIGSTNLDACSFSQNYEADISSCDPSFADSMLKVFRQDSDRSIEIRLPTWRSRGWPRRVKEFMAGTMRSQL
jgi:cardiolipin synthase A/B